MTDILLMPVAQKQDMIDACLSTGLTADRLFYSSTLNMLGDPDKWPQGTYKDAKWYRFHMDWNASAERQSVWAACTEIPEAETLSYSHNWEADIGYVPD